MSNSADARYFDIHQACQNALPTAVAARRRLHQNPELSGYERQTTEYIAQTLQDWGIPFQVIPDGGVLAFITGAVSGGTVLLRADCDALPIQEDAQNAKRAKTCVSRVPGVAHMCGHDAHTAMLLGSGKILQEHRGQLKGRVILLFERGEEGGGCIYYVMKYIQEHGIQIDSCWANHVVSDLPVGDVAIQGGPTNAAVFQFEIELTGKGGHASRPDRVRNPIDCFVAIADQLKDFSMRGSSPFTPLTYCISSVHAGTASNIVADSLQFSGTCRFFDPDAGQAFAVYLRQVTESCCANYHCQANYPLFQAPYLPTVCSQDYADFGRKVIGAQIGAEHVILRGPAMGSESYAVLCAYYPSVTAKVGVRNEEMGCTDPVHTPRFDIDESAMVWGMLMYVTYAVEFLLQNPATAFTPYPGTIDQLFQSMGCPVPQGHDVTIVEDENGG